MPLLQGSMVPLVQGSMVPLLRSERQTAMWHFPLRACPGYIDAHCSHVAGIQIGIVHVPVPTSCVSLTLTVQALHEMNPNRAGPA